MCSFFTNIFASSLCYCSINFEIFFKLKKKTLVSKMQCFEKININCQNKMHCQQQNKRHCQKNNPQKIHIVKQCLLPMFDEKECYKTWNSSFMIIYLVSDENVFLFLYSSYLTFFWNDFLIEKKKKKKKEKKKKRKTAYFF